MKSGCLDNKLVRIFTLCEGSSDADRDRWYVKKPLKIKYEFLMYTNQDVIWPIWKWDHIIKKPMEIHRDTTLAAGFIDKTNKQLCGLFTY